MVLNLRLHRRLARWLLAAYLLVLGISVLAAMLRPQAMEVVCSGMGVMKVVASQEDAPGLQTTIDCPLCAHATPVLPPPARADLTQVADARSHSVQRLPAAVLLARTAPPLPSRGPPLS
jgi:hypothetical protein